LKKRLDIFIKLLLNGSYFKIALKLSDYYIPDWLVVVGRSKILSFKDKKIKIIRRSKKATVQRAVPDDLPRIIKCFEGSDKEFVKELYHGYLEKGNLCYIVECDGHVVGYVWAFLNSYMITYDDYKRCRIPLCFDENSAFFGDGYIKPDYRLRGYFPLLMDGMVEDLKLNYNKNSFFANVEVVNDHSFKSHSGIGFSEEKTLSYISILGIKFLMVSDGKKNQIYNLNKTFNLFI